MKSLFRPLLILFSFSLLTFTVSAQSTLENIYTIMQTNCEGGSGCHGATNPSSFAIGQNATEFYNNVVGVDPENTVALSKKDKLIEPGYPEKSFLLRKIANCLSNDLALDDLNAEGVDMPAGEFPLTDSEIELVRQWILFDAQQTGNIPNEGLIEQYYTTGGIDKVIPPDAPPACDGFQMHIGPFFLDGGQEVEYLLKHQIDFDDDLEVIGFDVFMNIESHHFIIYRFNNQQDADAEDDGMRLVGLGGGEVPFQNQFVNAWADDDEYVVPNGTAFFFKKDEVLDLNYHLLNYNQNEILPAEVYVNVYTQPKGTADKEMKASLLIDNSTFASLILPPNASRTISAQFTGPNQTYSIWMLSSHTHSLGTDFDIFLRNPNGSKGQQVYEGFFNTEYTFNQGYYDWEHAAIKRMEPFLEINASDGLLYEASYENTTNSLKTWGLTTNDEMMLVYMQYVEGAYTIPTTGYTSTCTDTWEDPCANKTTAIGDNIKIEAGMEVYPNPSQAESNVLFTLSASANVTVEILDLSGRVVNVLLSNVNLAEGVHTQIIEASTLTKGVYLIRLTADGESVTTKMVKM